MEMSVTVGKTTIQHNTVQWSLKTNGHRDSYNQPWGWIQGAPGNVCWGNGDRELRYEDAQELARLHNQWMEDQKPIAFKIVEATAKVSGAQGRYDNALESLRTASEALDKAKSELSSLTPHPENSDG